jgi:hypothetical protein
MIWPGRRTHSANGPHWIKAAVALVVSAGCFGVLIYLLSPDPAAGTDGKIGSEGNRPINQNQRPPPSAIVRGA